MPSKNHVNNRRHMLKHPSQGDFKKVLCVCSGGLLRSPTIAWVLSNPPYNYNTRSCGITPKYALIQLDEYLVEWADEIVCVEQKHMQEVLELMSKHKFKDKSVKCLDLSDDYLYRDEAFIKIIKEKYDACAV